MGNILKLVANNGWYKFATDAILSHSPRGTQQDT